MNYPENDYRNYLIHYGVDHLHSENGRGSGRYPYGSGEKNKNRIKYDKETIKKLTKEAVLAGAKRLNDMSDDSLRLLNMLDEQTINSNIIQQQINSDIIQQQINSNIIQQQSINSGLMTMSLAASGGMNPFMFGMV